MPARGSVLPVLRVAFSRPSELYWAAHALGNSHRLGYEIISQPAPESSAAPGKLQVHLFFGYLQNFGSKFPCVFRELGGGYYLHATTRLGNRQRIHWLQGRMVQKWIVVLGGDLDAGAL